MSSKKKNTWTYKRNFFLILSLCWLTGIAFFVLDSFFTVEGDFGPEKHPWQFSILKIHGAAAFIIMIIFGYFLSSHVKKNWYKSGPKPILGVMMLVMPIICMISAYSLYYLVSDQSQKIVSYIHLAFGFFLPFVLIAHIKQVAKELKEKKMKMKLAHEN